MWPSQWAERFRQSYIRVPTCQYWLVLWLPFLFSHILGMSSSQLTFIFFRGVAQPPTRIKHVSKICFGIEFLHFGRPSRRCLCEQRLQDLLVLADTVGIVIHELGVLFWTKQFLLKNTSGFEHRCGTHSAMSSFSQGETMGFPLWVFH